MITHSIVVHKPQKDFSNTTTHKQQIFERTLKNLDTNIFYEGGTYQIRGKRMEGTLIYICQKLDEVEWDGLKVKMLELYFSDSQKTDLFHPSDLKEIKDA